MLLGLPVSARRSFSILFALSFPPFSRSSVAWVSEKIRPDGGDGGADGRRDGGNITNRMASLHVTIESIQKAILRAGSFRKFEQRLGAAYKLARRARGVNDGGPFALSFDERTPAPTVARYLTDRAFGGKTWHAAPDESMSVALATVVIVDPDPKPATPAASAPIRKASPVGKKASSSSPGVPALSPVVRLLLGVTQPDREPEAAVLAFLQTVRELNEFGVKTARDVTGLSRARLNQIARRFLSPSAEALQLRIDAILAKEPGLRAAVTRALAADIRAVQEEDQQLLRANQQLSQSLAEALKTLAIDDQEKARLRATIKQLDATRGLAVREINAALKFADAALVHNGAAGPAKMAQTLVGF